VDGSGEVARTGVWLAYGRSTLDGGGSRRLTTSILLVSPFRCSKFVHFVNYYFRFLHFVAFHNAHYVFVNAVKSVLEMVS
jgi:hypothetical protein